MAEAQALRGQAACASAWRRRLFPAQKLASTPMLGSSGNMLIPDRVGGVRS
jgi:hypothetical protein